MYDLKTIDNKGNGVKLTERQTKASNTQHFITCAAFVSRSLARSSPSNLVLLLEI